MCEEMSLPIVRRNTSFLYGVEIEWRWTGRLDYKRIIGRSCVFPRASENSSRPKLEWCVNTAQPSEPLHWGFVVYGLLVLAPP